MSGSTINLLAAAQQGISIVPMAPLTVCSVLVNDNRLLHLGRSLSGVNDRISAGYWSKINQLEEFSGLTKVMMEEDDLDSELIE